MITPGGRIGDASPLAKPGYTGGRRLDDYVRMVAHAFMRKGMGESHAIAAARTVLAKWARGEGNVTPKVRAAAAAALAHQAELDKRGTLNMSSSADELETSGSTLNRNVDIRTLDLSTLATDDTSPAPDSATDLDLAPGDYHKPYDWRHGYIPLTPAAVRSKLKLDKGKGRKGGSAPSTPRPKRLAGTFNHGPGSANSSNPTAKAPASPAKPSAGSTHYTKTPAAGTKVQIPVTRGGRTELDTVTVLGPLKVGNSTNPNRTRIRTSSGTDLDVRNDTMRPLAAPSTRRSSTTPGNAGAFEIPAQQKIDNAATMHGTGSKQHKAAQMRFGAQAQAEDLAGRGRGVPGAVEAAKPAPKKRAAAGSKKYAEQVTRANSGDLDVGLHAELRREGLLDADNHPTAKGKRAGLKPAAEREAAMRANHKPGDPTPPAERATTAHDPKALAEATVKAHIRLARTPGSPESTRTAQEKAAEKLAKKHGLDYTALDEQVRQDMYEQTGGGFTGKPLEYTLKHETDRQRAAANHLAHAELHRARGNQQGVDYHNAQAETHVPGSSTGLGSDTRSEHQKAADTARDERTKLTKAAIAAGYDPKRAPFDSADQLQAHLDAHEKGHPFPVGKAVNARQPGIERVTTGRVVGYTDNGMVKIQPHTGGPAGTFNPSHVAEAGRDPLNTPDSREGGGTPEHLKGKSARELRAGLTGRNDTPLSEKSDDELIALTRHSDPKIARAAELEYAKRGDDSAAGRHEAALNRDRPSAAETLAQARADKARLDAGGKARSDATAAGRVQLSDTEIGRGGISAATASKMSDAQLEDAVRRLMASGTYSGSALKVLEDEMNQRDKARAGKARGR